MDRTRADHMGMLATTINALGVGDTLEQEGVDVRVMTANFNATRLLNHTFVRASYVLR